MTSLHKYLKVLLCVLLFGLFNQASATDWLRMENDIISIQYTHKDSINARQALEILDKSYRELLYDLQIAKQEQLAVYIIPDRGTFRQIIQGRLPDWTGAFAAPAENAMYIKSPSWDPDSNYKATLVHELLHLLLHKKMGNVSIPRWLNEGLAIFYSGDQRWISSTALSKALTTGSVIPLDDIDRVLEFHRTRAELAYQESWSAVQYLLAVYDIDALRIILEQLRQRNSLDQAFQLATGSTFDGFEKEWLVYANKKFKWVWLHEIDQFVWILIIILFFLAFVLVRWRNHLKLKQWEQEALPDLPPEAETDTGPNIE